MFKNLAVIPALNSPTITLRENAKPKLTQRFRTGVGWLAGTGKIDCTIPWAWSDEKVEAARVAVLIPTLAIATVLLSLRSFFVLSISIIPSTVLMKFSSGFQPELREL